MEKRRRTIIKTITFRVIAILTTIAVSFYFTGNWSISLGIGIIAGLLKTVFYYLHERVWNRIDYGRH